MPPQELPTKWAASNPSSSTICSIVRAQSPKLKPALSGSLPPWPGGSIATTVCVAAKCSTCARHSDPVINRLGQKRIGGPSPTTSTRTRPSTVGTMRSLTWRV